MSVTAIQRGVKRGPFLLAIAPVVAAVAGGVRWLWQGSGNVYTAWPKRYYLPDPDFGWRAHTDGPLWLGLEVLAGLAAAALGALFVAWLTRRWERRRGAPVRWLRGVLAVGGALPLVVPIAAFATGFLPARAVEALPVGATAQAPTEGLEGSLDLPAGRYQVIAHAGSAITARVSAGEETFDARLAGGWDGAWEGDPRDLRRPFTATVSVAAASVDTGVALRSEHARDKYLAAGAHPRIALTIERLVAARQDRVDQIAFRAAARLELRGEAVPVEVTGTLRAADAAARERLGVGADTPTLLVSADLAITVRGSALRGHRSAFDVDRIPITVTLVLTRTP